jgi:hypothetical protein
MSFDWSGHANGFYGGLPHPDESSLKVSEFPTAVRLATLSKFGGHASAQEAGMFWKEFKATGLSPEQYEKLLGQVAPISFSYHGRPPTIEELVGFKDRPPADVKKFYADLPDKHYPHVSAGDMIKALSQAQPHAQEHLDRKPVKYEAAMHVTSGHTPQQIQDYYKSKSTKEESGGSQDIAGGSTGDPSQGDAGGRTARA